MADEITAATRVEKLLAEVLGEEYAVVPVTRIEKFISNILGAEYDLVPVTRIEKLLAKVAEEGGGGGGYTAADWGDPAKPDGAVTIDSTYTYDDRERCAYLFAKRLGITDVSMPNTTHLPNYYFFGSFLSKLNAPMLESVGSQSLGATRMQGIVLPSFKGTYAQAAFQNGRFEYADFGGAEAATLHANSFTNCPLRTLIIRASNVMAIANTNVFNGTPFASNGTGGTLYVPQALIADYQAATNWSTILGYTNNQILPIEGSIYETQYADGTPIS